MIILVLACTSFSQWLPDVWNTWTYIKCWVVLPCLALLQPSSVVACLRVFLPLALPSINEKHARLDIGQVADSAI